jgi:hypothetical protein
MKIIELAFMRACVPKTRVYLLAIWALTYFGRPFQ